MILDTSLFFAFNNFAGRSYLFDLLIIFLAQYLAYIVIVVFLITTWRARDRLAVFWIPLISGIIARAGITELIRFLYHRPRPFTTLQVHQLLSDSAWSFPSGHAAFFFALATGVYFHSKKWGIALFFTASIITINRVIAGIHYPLDILGGMLIGIACAYGARYIIGGHYTKKFGLISSRTPTDVPRAERVVALTKIVRSENRPATASLHSATPKEKHSLHF